MKIELNLSTWIANFSVGMYEAKDLDTQVKSGWYDWFCKDTSLAGKTKKVGQIIKQIRRGGKVDLINSYVWFKNNCPLKGPLYDDFRFADIETGDVIFTTQINCSFNKFKYTIYGRKNEFVSPLFETNSSRELVKWFNEGWAD